MLLALNLVDEIQLKGRSEELPFPVKRNNIYPARSNGKVACPCSMFSATIG
jgi:hypothetical protein